MIRASNILLLMEYLEFPAASGLRQSTEDFRCSDCGKAHPDPVMGIYGGEWVLACPYCSGSEVRRQWADETPGSWTPPVDWIAERIAARLATPEGREGLQQAAARTQAWLDRVRSPVRKRSNV